LAIIGILSAAAKERRYQQKSGEASFPFEAVLRP
jgi:hypothetical protein